MNSAIVKTVKAIFIALTVLVSAASVRAQGDMSAFSSVQISAATVNLTSVDFTTGINPQPYLAESNTSLTPIPPASGSVDIVANTVNFGSFTFFTFASPANGTSPQFVTGEVNFDTYGVSLLNGESYGGLPQSPSFQGIQIRRDTGSDVLLSTSLPQAPVSDLSSDFQPSILSIQPAPEPSTLALGILGLGLMAMIWVRNKAKSVQIQDATERF